jgi:hypothetical protein
MRGRWRQRFASLLERIAAIAVSTVSQFTDDHKILTTITAPKPWKPHPPLHTTSISSVQMSFFGLALDECPFKYLFRT